MKNMFSRAENATSTITFVPTNEKKSTVLNTRAIKLFDFFDLYCLEADRGITTISSNLYVFKATGKIKEGMEILKGDGSYFSAFLGLVNVQGVNFLLLVKEVALHFALDGRDKIFEIQSVEFKEICESNQPTKVTKDVQEFLHHLDKILSGGGFYFSYTYPLTVSQQRATEQQQPSSTTQLPVNGACSMHLVDYDYMWNYHLMKPLIQQRVTFDWQVQLIQGHVYNIVAFLPSLAYITLISRRQTRRAGTRYNHRGINSEGYVANSVETEIVMMIPSVDSIVSHV